MPHGASLVFKAGFFRVRAVRRASGNGTKCKIKFREVVGPTVFSPFGSPTAVALSLEGILQTSFDSSVQETTLSCEEFDS